MDVGVALTSSLGVAAYSVSEDTAAAGVARCCVKWIPVVTAPSCVRKNPITYSPYSMRDSINKQKMHVPWWHARAQINEHGIQQTERGQFQCKNCMKC